MNKDKYTAFEVNIEPTFIPGEGRAIEYLKGITMTVFAKDIHEAMQKAQDLLRIDSNTYEFASVVRTGAKCSTSWSPF